jgi:hypothetical protein
LVAASEESERAAILSIDIHGHIIELYICVNIYQYCRDAILLGRIRLTIAFHDVEGVY